MVMEKSRDFLVLLPYMEVGRAAMHIRHTHDSSLLPCVV